jgi:hypothetical protein
MRLHVSCCSDMAVGKIKYGRCVTKVEGVEESLKWVSESES